MNQLLHFSKSGVSTILQSKDILDIDCFWDKELSRANKDRLFGCSFNDLNSERSGVYGAKVQGLIGSHAYSVLRAVLCNGKRFVVVRNPWGMSEWTGRWSDGAKEWTQEWLRLLPELGHEFGDDGQFVMECMSLDRLRPSFSNSLQIPIGWIASRISTGPYSLTKHGQCRHNGLRSLVRLYLLHGHMERYLVRVNRQIFSLPAADQVDFS